MKQATLSRIGEIILRAIEIVAVLLLIEFAMRDVLGVTKTKYNEKFYGEVRTVTSAEINFREEPRGNIIGTLKKGEKVKLTGNWREASIGRPDDDIWYEVTVNGTTGWVYANYVK